MDDATFRMMTGAALWDVGQQEWTTPGTYQFKVPDVPHISAVLVGGADGGNAGGRDVAGDGGDGGDLRFARKIDVTPGEILTVIIGAGGSTTAPTGTGQTGGKAGSPTRILRGSTVLLSAGRRGVDSTPLSENVGGGNGGSGGGSGGTEAAGGGAGAAGYSGNGGRGESKGIGAVPFAPGTGGAAAGAVGAVFGRGGAAGGGVGLSGEGSPGVSSSQGGSDGASGTGPIDDTSGQYPHGGNGGRCGGGGGGGGAFPSGTFSSAGRGGSGGSGGGRIIWGPGRAYPSTNTQDM